MSDLDERLISCYACKEHKPATPEFFHKGHGRTGARSCWYSYCKACVSAMGKAKTLARGGKAKSYNLLPRAEKRGKFLIVCLTPGEHEQLHAQAREARMPASSYARSLLLPHLHAPNQAHQ